MTKFAPGLAGARADDLFVFHGSEGEYVLAPFCEEVRRRGFPAVELVGGLGDVGEGLDQVSSHGGRRILVTSHHLLYDGPSMNEWVLLKGCLSPLEVRQRLRPDLTIYCPHDLSTPFLADELHYADQIDLYLAATPMELSLRRRMDVELAGWLKYLRPASGPVERHGRALWLAQGYELTVRWHGAEMNFAEMKPHLRDWCAVKFGPMELLAPLEALLREHGTTVIDRNRSAADLVPHYDLVISNGETSVVREAALMGKPVFILTHPDLFSRFSRADMVRYTDLPNLHFVADIDDIPHTVEDLPAQLQPFDFDRALAAIYQRL